MKTFLQKLKYYNDINLFLFILRNIVLVLFTPVKKRLALAEVQKDPGITCSKEKVEKYVTLVYFIMGRLWIRPSCFNNSIAVCRIFKKNGIDASIVFGAAFEKKKLKGHCWVETDKKAIPEKFEPIFSYPF